MIASRENSLFSSGCTENRQQISCSRQKRRRKPSSGRFLFFLGRILLAAFIGTAVPVSAAGRDTQPIYGSLTLEFRDSRTGEALPGIFTFYRIGEIQTAFSASGGEDTETSVGNTPVSLIPDLELTYELLSGPGDEIVSPVQDYYRKASVCSESAGSLPDSVYTGTVGGDGILTIDKILQGIYLAVRTGGGPEASASSFFITVPQAEESVSENGTARVFLSYDVYAAPKAAGIVPSPSVPVPERKASPAVPAELTVQTGDENMLPDLGIAAAGIILIILTAGRRIRA